VNYKFLILLSVLVTATFNAAAAEMLRHNPFEQPDNIEGRNQKVDTRASAKLELRGTVMDGDDSVANIDGEYYRLNQEVSGYHVVRIESGSVTLSRSGIETVLTLYKDE